jgi:hypothetical protein
VAWPQLTTPTGTTSKSLVGVVTLASSPAEAEANAAAAAGHAGSTTVSTPRPQVVGWEKNAAGKMGARMADLAPMMDPVR